MVKPENLLQLLRLPPEFGVAILIFSFALSVTPYLAGSDFGVIKIPLLSHAMRKRLRTAGPVALFVAIFLHLPLLSSQTASVAPVSRGTPASIPPRTSSAPPPQPSPAEPEHSPHRKDTVVAVLDTPPITEQYRVNLLIPTALSQATVWVDGREAIVVQRTATVIQIDVSAMPASHQIYLEQNGNKKCIATFVVKQNGSIITPCAN
ncbi:MAG: hypothetical protein ACRD3J_17370 [Thermoanaerobaculia bacterium]